jgi:hypothetical protein
LYVTSASWAGDAVMGVAVGTPPVSYSRPPRTD